MCPLPAVHPRPTTITAMPDHPDQEDMEVEEEEATAVNLSRVVGIRVATADPRNKAVGKAKVKADMAVAPVQEGIKVVDHPTVVEDRLILVNSSIPNKAAIHRVISKEVISSHPLLRRSVGASAVCSAAVVVITTNNSINNNSISKLLRRNQAVWVWEERCSPVALV